VALDERNRPDGAWYAYPAHAPMVDEHAHAGSHEAYDLCLELPDATGEAYLWLGPRLDSWPMDSEERASLESLAKFAAMSLEHARLTHQQAEAARLDSLPRVTKQLHSHDLKNRLNDLSFLAHHLGSGKLEEEDVARMLSAIKKVTGRMQTLMQRMNDPNAPVDLAIAPIDLVALLKRSVKDRLWPESITIVDDYQLLPAVAGDSDQLQGVFENLYDNGVQSMQRQGEIRIQTRLVKNSENIDVAEVRVSDQGCGMTPEFLKNRLFRLFATSKSNGLGVGLYLSRRIVEAHGGNITAQSEGTGKGSTFIVQLPLWQDKHVK